MKETIIKPIESNKKKTSHKVFLILCPIVIFLSCIALGYIVYVISKKGDVTIESLEKKSDPAELTQKKEIMPKTIEQKVIEEQLQDGVKMRIAAERKIGKEATWKIKGVLWIDRETFKCFINRGTSDGVHKGAHVDIFDKSEKVGEAKIVEVFEAISYAELINQITDDFIANSYRVVIRY